MALNNSMIKAAEPMTTKASKSAVEPTRRRSVPTKPDGKRTTTSIVIKPYTLALYQRVAGYRAAIGATETTEAGIERTYSVSALYREIMEQHIPDLEAELNKAGIALPVNPDDEIA